MRALALTMNRQSGEEDEAPEASQGIAKAQSTSPHPHVPEGGEATHGDALFTSQESCLACRALYSDTVNTRAGEPLHVLCKSLEVELLLWRIFEESRGGDIDAPWQRLAALALESIGCHLVSTSEFGQIRRFL